MSVFGFGYEVIDGDTLKINKLTPEVINDLLPKYNKIILDNDFNDPLPELHDSVTHLTFGYRFNQPLEVGVIPNSVTNLAFGTDFDANQVRTVNGFLKFLLHLLRIQRG